MKIKTIWSASNVTFDAVVNELLEQGWKLVRREVIVDHNDLGNSVFYAEMVLEEMPKA